MTVVSFFVNLFFPSEKNHLYCTVLLLQRGLWPVWMGREAKSSGEKQENEL